MKIAVLHHYLKGSRLLMLLWQICFALIGAATTLWLAFNAPENSEKAGGIVSLMLTLWMFGWAIGPTLFGGEDPTLRPEYFRNIPVKPGKLATSLTLASVAGVSVPASLIAFSSLIVYGARFGVATALAAALLVPILLLFSLFLSRVITNTLRSLTKSNLTSIISSALIGAVMAFTVTGWVMFGAVGNLTSNGIPDNLQQILFYLPSGWPIVAIDTAADGDWLPMITLIAVFLTLIAALAWLWGKLLAHRLTTSHIRNQSGTRHSLLSGRQSMSGVAATVRKELLTWGRDYTRSGFLYFAFFFSIATCLYPLVIGVDVLLLIAGLLYIVSAVGSTSNLYGVDGSALWQILTTPHAARNDVRGRQIAWLIVILIAVIPTTIIGVAWSGIYAAWPAVAGLTAAALGAGAGVTVTLSVFRLIPMTDPQLRGDDMFEHGMDWPQFMMSMLLTVVLTAPVAVLVWYSVASDTLWLEWLAIPLGVGLGTLWFWLLGRIAYKRLKSHGPELLNKMRKSGSSETLDLGITKESLGLDGTLSASKAAVVYSLFTIAPLLIIPQGIVPAIFKLANSGGTSWFLALYLPEIWQWPAIISTTILGILLLWTAFSIYRRESSDQ
ncbi:hypothetical protein PV379_02090 [Streptomyces caniscabiei]|uniref:hypothetical protein n=1 Tax=Streptomyces caniscabiei TaxID=2746961 RepID=UPI0029B6A358|nr:hypothetical protein [Streptomyces caniscabiei]MDX2776144.1 hypothetical protein [Streptomyces caniscabiei]